MMISAILILGLGTFLVLMLGFFKKDKLAYLYDSGLQNSRSLSETFNTYIKQSYRDLSIILGQLDTRTQSFNAEAISRWQWQSDVVYMGVYKKTPGGEIEFIAELSKPQQDRLEHWNSGDRAEAFLETGDRSASLFPIDDHGFARGIYKFQGTESYIALVSLDMRKLLKLISNDRGDISLLLNHRGKLLLSNNNQYAQSPEFLKSLASVESFNGSKLLSADDGREYLASFNQLNHFGIQSVIASPYGLAMLPIYIAVEKIVYLFFALLAGLFAFGLFFSNQITAPLNSFKKATDQISEGDFEVDLKVKTQDEMGLLAKSFNKMSQEISRLMLESLKKGRLESELETARTVQDTLFPNPSYWSKELSVEGYCQPASECGGDWWYHHEYDDCVLIFVGDATGHGAPAALLTAAARSAFSVVQRQGLKEPKEVLKTMNEALHDTARGKVNMTAFVVKIDKEGGGLSYSIASHNRPFIVPREFDEKTRPRSLKTLAENNHPRLGERVDVEYEQTDMVLEPHQHLVVYSDGLTELKNPENKDWGERKFIRSVLGALAKQADLNQAMKQVQLDVDQYRQGCEYEDDFTLVFIKRTA